MTEYFIPKRPPGIYQSEHRSAFCRFYAGVYYMDATFYPHGSSENRLFLNECIQWDQLANEAFERGN